jgi:hypothetical protein
MSWKASVDVSQNQVSSPFRPDLEVVFSNEGRITGLTANRKNSGLRDKPISFRFADLQMKIRSTRLSTWPCNFKWGATAW